MNKIVVITGGNSGIGKSTADLYRAKGDIAISISLDIDKEYPQYSYVCDITDEENMKNTFSQIGEKYNKIDILINCAAMGVNGALELLPSSTVKKVIDVNVVGSYLASKYSLPYMQKGSKIIYISSVNGLMGAPFRSLYCFTKSAIVMMANCQRMELKGAGIDVSTICPGVVKTQFMKNRIRIDNTNERYQEQVSRAFDFLDKKDSSKRMSPEKVANIIVKHSYKKRTKPLKILGFDFKCMYLATKLLPLNWTLNMTNRIMGGYKGELK